MLLYAFEIIDNSQQDGQAIIFSQYLDKNKEINNLFLKNFN